VHRITKKTVDKLGWNFQNKFTLNLLRSDYKSLTPLGSGKQRGEIFDWWHDPGWQHSRATQFRVITRQVEWKVTRGQTYPYTQKDAQQKIVISVPYIEHCTKKLVSAVNKVSTNSNTSRGICTSWTNALCLSISCKPDTNMFLQTTYTFIRHNITLIVVHLIANWLILIND